MSEPLRLHPVGAHAGSLRERLMALAGTELVDDPARAELVVMTPEDLAELVEEVEATAAYHRSRDQERVPIEVVDRLLAGENPVKVWREYRGLSQRALAAQAGLNFAYLSQIETGARKGPVGTMKKLANILGVGLDELT
jgi:DNA-binding XRE family transcriptional regulator